MKIIFYDSPGKRVVTELVKAALEKGLRKHASHMIPYAHDFVSGKTNIDSSEAVIVFGISNEARVVVAECKGLGKPYFIVDKGYIRRKSRGDIEHNAYWRMSPNSMHPEFNLSSGAMPLERWHRLKLELEKTRTGKGSGYILLIAPALRVFNFLGLCTNVSSLSKFFDEVAVKVLAITDRHVVFRGKLDSKMAFTKEGWQFSPKQVSHSLSGRTIESDIQGASIVVTHTTNAGVRAVMAGVPVVELGVGVVKPLAETDLGKINNPKRYTEEERERFFHWLAWQQWTLAEMISGEAWAYFKPQIL